MSMQVFQSMVKVERDTGVVFYSILQWENLRFKEVQYLSQDYAVNILDTNLNPGLSFCSFAEGASQD